jgi:hypothetical protein
MSEQGNDDDTGRTTPTQPPAHGTPPSPTESPPAYGTPTLESPPAYGTPPAHAPAPHEESSPYAPPAYGTPTDPGTAPFESVPPTAGYPAPAPYPAQQPYPGQGSYSTYPGQWGGYPEASQGTLALVLGIIGLFAFWPLSPFAWIVGRNEVRGVDAGRRDPANRGLGLAGQIMGIIGTVFLVLSVILVVVAIVLVVAVGTSTVNS